MMEGASRMSESEPSESRGDNLQRLFFPVEEILRHRCGAMVEDVLINSTTMDSPSESVRLIISDSCLMLGVRVAIGSRLIR